eukprot:CAMPEP_0180043774 /NCGR_PEP_ID=MMETSP0984-20121128/35571_1 /TAXON_ID=483367 /ORGANISM="non described non described, Strain CCMP 2436" /LENGTH=122 /DNA_ID=CAMNT_0021971901 /DNA_START=46 /DNA_END=415 /DNA_ORIENTATION=-
MTSAAAVRVLVPERQAQATGRAPGCRARRSSARAWVRAGRARRAQGASLRRVAQPAGAQLHPLGEPGGEGGVLDDQLRHAAKDEGLRVELHLEGLPALEQRRQLVRVGVSDARARGDDVDEV